MQLWESITSVVFIVNLPIRVLEVDYLCCGESVLMIIAPLKPSSMLSDTSVGFHGNWAAHLYTILKG